MKLYILVEGKSEQTFLRKWLPRFIPQHTFQIITHQGKGKLPRNPGVKANPMRRGLLDQLPMKLRAYGKTLNSGVARVLVLIDQDDDDCRELKNRVQTLLDQINPKPETMIRIATREIEAFYLGDKVAVKKAYPRLNKKKLDQYNPSDDPETGHWERFAEIINDDSEDKVKWAADMGEVLAVARPFPKNNTSVSFRHFCKAILQLVGEPD